MKQRIVPLVALAVLALLALSVRAAEDFQGILVSAASGKVTFTTTDGKEHTHEVATDAKITRDGKTAKLEELQKGDNVTVKTERRLLKNWVTFIDAKAPGGGS